MKEYSAWVNADASRTSQEASVSFLNFMSNRFPCKDESKQ
jgi:hypothetical protein